MRHLYLFAFTTAVAFASGCDSPTSHDPEVLAYGKHLAQECFACHQSSPANANQESAIPKIMGMKLSDFQRAMKEYQTGKRTNAAMVSVANSLDDEQLDALGQYLQSE